MNAYYNEFEPFCCAWLKELQGAHLIVEGEIDGRDIKDVTPDELRGFSQWHLFAGIGVWSAALRMAGWPDDREVLTVSCPCQPFSSAGRRKGTNDERHLWPAALRIIRELKPAVIFGEQVASSEVIGRVSKVRTSKAEPGVSARAQRRGDQGHLPGLRECGRKGAEGMGHSAEALISKRTTDDAPGICPDGGCQEEIEGERHSIRSVLAGHTEKDRCGCLRSDWNTIRPDGPEGLECPIAGPDNPGGWLHPTEHQGGSLCPQCHGWNVGHGQDAGDSRGGSFKEDIATDESLTEDCGTTEVADSTAWIDNVFLDLERAGYTCGAVVFPACSVGAPHIRQRLYFAAVRLDDAAPIGRQPESHVGSGDAGGDGAEGQRQQSGVRCGDEQLADALPAGRPEGWPESGHGQTADGGNASRLDDPEAAIGRRAGGQADTRRGLEEAGGSSALGRLDNSQCNGAARANAPEQSGDRQDNGLPRQASAGGRLGDPGCTGDERWGATGHLGCAPSEEQGEARQRERRGDANCDSGIDRRPGPVNGLWSRADWLFCRDGKWRPVESGTFPLADAGAFRNRVAELRGAGNALCIAQAAEFIGAVMDCLRAPHTDRSAA